MGENDKEDLVRIFLDLEPQLFTTISSVPIQQSAAFFALGHNNSEETCLVTALNKRNSAVRLQDEGKYRKAVAALETSLDSLASIVGWDHDQTIEQWEELVSTILSYAGMKICKGQFDNALELLKRVVHWTTPGIACESQILPLLLFRSNSLHAVYFFKRHQVSAAAQLLMRALSGDLDVIPPMELVTAFLRLSTILGDTGRSFMALQITTDILNLYIDKFDGTDSPFPPSPTILEATPEGEANETSTIRSHDTDPLTMLLSSTAYGDPPPNADEYPEFSMTPMQVAAFRSPETKLQYNKIRICALHNFAIEKAYHNREVEADDTLAVAKHFINTRMGGRIPWAHRFQLTQETITNIIEVNQSNPEDSRGALSLTQLRSKPRPTVKSASGVPSHSRPPTSFSRSTSSMSRPSTSRDIRPPTAASSLRATDVQQPSVVDVPPNFTSTRRKKCGDKPTGWSVVADARKRSSAQK